MDILMYFLEDHPFLKTNTFSLITFHIYVCGFYWMEVECRYHKLVMYSHAQWRVNHDFSRDLTICIEIKICLILTCFIFTTFLKFLKCIKFHKRQTLYTEWCLQPSWKCTSNHHRPERQHIHWWLIYVMF